LRGGPCGFGAAFAIGRLLALRRKRHFLLPLDGDCASVFHGLHCLPRGHRNRLPTCFALLIGFSGSQALLSLCEGLGSETVRAHAPCDLDCVTSFVPRMVS
jgi:hypothetical protein